MGTRCLIAKEAGGKYKTVYCHWDGYPAYVGKVLREHYKDEEKINELLNHGDMSSLGKKLGEKHPFDKCPDDECNFYGRDRGEKGTDAKMLDNPISGVKSWQEYVYIWKDGMWHCWDVHEKKWVWGEIPELT